MEEKYKEQNRQAQAVYFKVLPRLGIRPSMQEIGTFSEATRGSNPLTIHYYLFIGAIKNLASEE